MERIIMKSGVILLRYIPKHVLDDIKPIVDRLQTYRETRENSNSSGRHEENF